MRQSTLRKLDRYTFFKRRGGPLTCSTKSVYSMREDILSEEQDGDDEDSEQDHPHNNEQDAIMDEQEDDILSETSANVPIEEEEGADE